MPKAGPSLPKELVRKIRDVHKQVIKTNSAFKDFVSAQTKGLTGNQRQTAWGKAITSLVRRNPIYKEAVRAKIRSLRGGR
jgi:hypothetical protein